MPFKPPEYSDQIDQTTVVVIAHHIKSVVDAGGEPTFDEGAVGFVVHTNLYDDNNATDAVYSATLNSTGGLTHLYKQIDDGGGEVSDFGFAGDVSLIHDDNDATKAIDSNNGSFWFRGDRGNPLNFSVPDQVTIPNGHNLKEGAEVEVLYNTTQSSVGRISAHSHIVTLAEETTAITFGDPFDNPIPNDLSAQWIHLRFERFDSGQPAWEIPEVRFVIVGATPPGTPKDAWLRYDRGTPTTIQTPTRLSIPIDHAFVAGWTLQIAYGSVTSTGLLTLHHVHTVTTAEAVPGVITVDFPSLPDPEIGVSSALSRYIFFVIGVPGTTEIPSIPELRFTDTPVAAVNFNATVFGPEILRNNVTPNNVIVEMLSGQTFSVANGPGRRLLRYRYHNLDGADLAILDGFWATSREGAFPMQIIPHDDETDTPLSVFITEFEKNEDSKNPGAGETYQITIEMLENV